MRSLAALGMTWRCAALGMTVLLLCGAAPLAGQAALRGIVRQDSTGTPIAGVDVLIEGSQARTTSDNAGRFMLGGIPAGRHVALLRSVGYRPVRLVVTLAAGDTAWMNAELVPATVQLDPLLVTAQPKGPRGLGVEAFEERRRLGFGRFIDSTELRRKEHLRLGQVMGGSGRKVYAVSTRRIGIDGAPCYSSVYLDGTMLFRSPGPPGTILSDSDPPLLDLNTIYAAELTAVEIYRSSAEVPQEYGGASAACGVILLWSRRN